MSLIGTVVGYVLTVFLLVLLARAVLDWATMLTSVPPWAARGRRLAHAATEPVLVPARRVLRPVRAGGMSIDIAFTVVFIVALILRSVAFSL